MSTPTPKSKLETLATDIADNCTILLDDRIKPGETVSARQSRLDAEYTKEWQRVYDFELGRHTKCPHVLNDPGVAKPLIYKVEVQVNTAKVNACLNSGLHCLAGCGYCVWIDVVFADKVFDKTVDILDSKGVVTGTKDVYRDVQYTVAELARAKVNGSPLTLKQWLINNAAVYNASVDHSADIATINTEVGA